MKVDYEIRECDCCHNYYRPTGGSLADYTIAYKGREFDLCNNCKANLINFINNNIKYDKEGQK